jgi:Flp pilus assembly protein TadD
MSPHDPQAFLFNVSLAIAHYLADRYPEAVIFARKAVQQRANFSGAHRIFAASLAQAGQGDEASAALSQLRELQPDISIAWVEENIPYKPNAMAKLVAGLRRAGLD